MIRLREADGREGGERKVPLVNSRFVFVSREKVKLLIRLFSVLASLYEVVSVGPSVGPSVRPSVGRSVGFF